MSDQSTSHIDYARIEKAIQFLEANYKSHPSLDQIAEHIHLSPFHFERLFKRWAGVTPKQFVHFLTLKFAKEKLDKSSSVLNAAYDAGLSSGSRLHDMFIKIEGITPGEYKSGGKDLDIKYGFHPTQFGECFIASTPRGICNIYFNKTEERAQIIGELQAVWPNANLVMDQEEHIHLVDLITHRIDTRIENNSNSAESIPLHVKGTNFQLQVWQALLKIPAGEVVSYQDLALAINKPEASRAVGSAVAKNPVGYLIPCHRVIRKSGVLGDYRWGSARKKAILGWEAARKNDVSFLSTEYEPK